MYQERTPEQIDAANRYHTYMRGWQDGCRAVAKRKDHAEHPTLGSAYNDGYADGTDLEVLRRPLRASDLGMSRASCEATVDRHLPTWCDKSS